MRLIRALFLLLAVCLPTTWTLEEGAAGAGGEMKDAKPKKKAKKAKKADGDMGDMKMDKK